jgi:membrane associated rhomboid family serine protease
VNLTPEDLLALREKVKIIFNAICMLWGVNALNWAAFQGRMNRVFGIRPRELLGLLGIVTGHFLHLDQRHLIGNTQALLVLGGLVILQSIPLFGQVTVLAALVAGIGTWIAGANNTSYVGASGVIFGYLGFLLTYGITTGNLLALLLASIAGIWYGRLIVDILPGRQGGWIGHLFGFIGGILAAYWLGYLQVGQ